MGCKRGFHLWCQTPREYGLSIFQRISKLRGYLPDRWGNRIERYLCDVIFELPLIYFSVRTKRQFNQNFFPGSSSINIDCSVGLGGCPDFLFDFGQTSNAVIREAVNQVHPQSYYNNIEGACNLNIFLFMKPLQATWKVTCCKWHLLSWNCNYYMFDR